MRGKAAAKSHANCIAAVCFMLLPTIALSQLAISVRLERPSRLQQTSVAALNGLDYKTAQLKVHDTNLNVRVLAKSA